MSERKLLFISVFNHGGIELAKNHLTSLITNGITNYKAYCTGNETESELRALGYNVEKIHFDIGESKYDFSSQEFNKLSYLRYALISKLMRSGYDVWYLDIDTVVCGDLNAVYQQSLVENKYNLLFQNDVNMLCTGCVLFLRHPSTERFVYQCITMSRNVNENDQMQINKFLNRKMRDPELKIGIFPYYQFPNGLIFFKDDFVKTNVSDYFRVREKFHSSPKNVLFVHANWMTGIDTKINALKAYGLWHL